jgi:hypothetical protein
MNGYSKAGIVFAIIAGIAGAFIAYQYWEVQEIKNNLLYRNQATCAPNNIFLDPNTKYQLCQAELQQRQMDELKEVFKGILS